MNFKEELKKYQNYIDEKLDEYFKDDNTYEKRLRESMRYSLLAGGKRIRPILMLATYRLFKEDFEKCLPFAVGMEMVHNASLIHDLNTILNAVSIVFSSFAIWKLKTNNEIKKLKGDFLNGTHRLSKEYILQNHIMTEAK